MRDATFLRSSLALPIVVPLTVGAIGWLTGAPALGEFALIVAMSLVYAGPPYLLMAGAVLVWTRGPDERALPRLRVAMAVAPIAFAPLVAVYVRALEYFTVADKLLYARYSEAGHMALISIVVGYACVVVVWIMDIIRVSLRDDPRRPPAV